LKDSGGEPLKANEESRHDTGSMTEYIKAQRLLPLSTIQQLQETTPLELTTDTEQLESLLRTLSARGARNVEVGSAKGHTRTTGLPVSYCTN
jgi:hypothetical protein